MTLLFVQVLHCLMEHFRYPLWEAGEDPVGGATSSPGIFGALMKSLHAEITIQALKPLCLFIIVFI
jgi:hypothetical protein